MNLSEPGYRGRLAPSPTGYLHLGHARTFWIAQERARARNGGLILRNDDLDQARCQPGFVTAMLEDLRWFGLAWSEGPDCGGPFAPYDQSRRMEFYRAALEKLRAGNFIYPCTCSRKDIAAAARAPHAGDDEEPLYPGTCRPSSLSYEAQASSPAGSGGVPPPASGAPITRGGTVCEPAVTDGRAIKKISWRFLVPEGETISFLDGNQGPQSFVAGRDFGDFVVWRPDDVPAYHLACVADDAAMQITEVVRGADLLRSTARQILLYRALGLTPPAFYHCDLLRDEAGRRLAKRHDSLSLRHLRASGKTAESLRRNQFITESKS